MKPVLFIRSASLPDDALDVEWLEPVQICCAFDCPTTLLLLRPAASDVARFAPSFTELHALDIADLAGVEVGGGTSVRSIDQTEAQALIRSHAFVLSI